MPTLEVSNETYEKIKDQLSVEESVDFTDYDDLIGHKFFFRAVTFHLVGRVVKRLGDFLELENASWVASSGRFMNAIKDGSLDEVEPVGRQWINLKTVVDFCPWNHALPENQK